MNRECVMAGYNQLIDTAKSIGCDFLLNEPMKKHTTFRIGGPCDIMLMPETRAQAISVIKACRNLNFDYIIIGNGSDMVFGSGGYNGAVVCMCRLNSIKVENTSVYCDAGVNMSALCNAALENALTGAERLFGIPGTVGGAVCMNAGAYGGQVGDILVSCDYYDGENIVTVPVSDMELSYRHSLFSDGSKAVLGARFEFKQGDKAEIRKAMTDYIERRKSKQPVEYPSAGSVFLRPEGHFAGALVEQCGFKGKCVGDAQVSEKHCGFIINKGNATSSDVKNLVADIKRKVLSEKGVSLQCEIKFIGED